MLEVVVAIDMTLEKCVDGAELLNSTTVRNWLEGSVGDSLSVYEAGNATVWHMECAGCAENCQAPNGNATGSYKVTSKVVVSFPSVTLFSGAETRVGESTFPSYWAGCLDGDCNNRLLSAFERGDPIRRKGTATGQEGDDDDHAAERRRLDHHIPTVDLASATATYAVTM